MFGIVFQFLPKTMHFGAYQILLELAPVGVVELNLRLNLDRTTFVEVKILVVVVGCMGVVE